MVSPFASKTQAVVDFTIVITGFGLIFLVLYFYDFAGQGFYCDDESIQYPDKKSTINAGVLAATLICIPVALIFLTELFRWKQQKTGSFPGSIIAKVLGVYSATLFLGVLILCVLKIAVGRLRPNFFAVCQPDFSRINCSQGYITEYTCMNTNLSSYYAKDFKMSFPSGHASLTTSTAVFLILYIHERLVIRPGVSYLLKPSLSMMLVIYAAIVAASRITDNKHHPTDVVAGCFIGFVVSYLTYVVMAVPTFASDTQPTSYTNMTTSKAAYAVKPQPDSTDIPILITDKHFQWKNAENGCS